MERLYVKEMQKCITLAKKGMGMTSPNPMVGCVILNSNGKVVSSGYHRACGLAHAERDALLKSGDFRGCTLVVNLEPCSHYGKTPPCADLIIEKGIETVVYGMKDPNPKVAGKGLKKLKDAGINIIGPVLEEECKKLNEVFYKNHTQQKTFVALKTATTIDGKISTKSGDSKWITSEKSRNEVKKIRKYYDAILTSSSTIIADNPSMLHKNKIILDRELKTDLDFNIYKEGNIYVFYSEDKNNTLELKQSTRPDIKYIKTPSVNNKLDINFVLQKIYQLDIMSVFVESGGSLNGSFLPHIDKLYHFIAPKILGDNSGKSCFDGLITDKISQCTNLKFESSKIFGDDILVIYSK